MEHPALKAFEDNQMRKDVPYFQPGDTVKVNTRVIEGEKERIQVFEGVVIKRCGGGVGETFTVRKISYGVGIERCFPLHSPRIESIKVTRRGRVRRAKLYYLRDRVGKATRIKERRKAWKKEWLDTPKKKGKKAKKKKEAAPVQVEANAAETPQVENAATE